MDEIKRKQNSFPTFDVKEYIFDELYARYQKETLTRKELAYELNISHKSLANRIYKGTMCIRYAKSGTSKQAPIHFPILYVAEFIAYEYFNSNLLYP